MKHMIIVILTIVLFAGCSREQRQYGGTIDPKAKVISVDELVKNPSAYKGQMLTVEGTMGNICSDGEDFFFKGKSEVIEVTPPYDQMPARSLKGKPAKVYGKVLIKHEKKEKGETEDYEIKVEAKGVRFE